MGKLIHGFESLCIESHPTEEEIESISAIQSVLDIIESPLFTTVVDISIDTFIYDIRDQCKKVEILFHFLIPEELSHWSYIIHAVLPVI